MEGPGASGLGLGSALWPGDSWTSGRDRSISGGWGVQGYSKVNPDMYYNKTKGRYREKKNKGKVGPHTDPNSVYKMLSQGPFTPMTTTIKRTGTIKTFTWVCRTSVFQPQ